MSCDLLLGFLIKPASLCETLDFFIVLTEGEHMVTPTNAGLGHPIQLTKAIVQPICFLTQQWPLFHLGGLSAKLMDKSYHFKFKRSTVILRNDC